jgi:hypothetical protein
MGASGGGCVLVIAKADSIVACRAAVQSLGAVLDFALDDHGLEIVRTA